MTAKEPFSKLPIDLAAIFQCRPGGVSAPRSRIQIYLLAFAEKPGMSEFCGAPGGGARSNGCVHRGAYRVLHFLG
jgi:hypothetical protein